MTLLRRILALVLSLVACTLMVACWAVGIALGVLWQGLTVGVTEGRNVDQSLMRLARLRARTETPRDDK